PATRSACGCWRRRTSQCNEVGTIDVIMPPPVRNGRRVAIVGLGLIGGSLGMARRGAGGWEVVGQNRHHEAAGRARKMGGIDRAEWNLPKALEGADVVVLAVAPMAMQKVMADVAPHLEPGAVVTDVASTKGDVLAWA